MSEVKLSDKKGKIRWGVVATVREPLALILGFISYHLDKGAEEIHLYFDAPNDPVADIAETIEGVFVTRCDAEHWQALGEKNPPRLQTRRQTFNANLAMMRAQVDWLVHIDADEFLWLPEPLEDELARVTGEARWLHIPNIERCWMGTPGGRIFDGVFRTDIRDRPGLDEAVYGKRAQALSGGLGGHSAGKAMARTGDGFLAIHKVREAEGGATLPKAVARSARILHFDGITPRHWALKNLRYATQGPAMNKLLNRQRMATIGAILRAPNPEKAAVAVHAALYGLSEEQAEMLEAEGKLFRPDVDIEGAVARIVPERVVDFSDEAFDKPLLRELSARSQAIVRQKRRAKRNIK